MTFEEFKSWLVECPVENVDGTDEMEEAYNKAPADICEDEALEDWMEQVSILYSKWINFN